MILIIFFLGRTLDLLVTQIALNKDYVELNLIAKPIIGNAYYAMLINAAISLGVYGIYEYLKSFKVVRDLVYFFAASNFIIAFYGLMIIKYG